MASIEIRGLEELRQGLSALQSEHLPFAMAKTLTDVALAAKVVTIEEMRRVFDRPTPFTLNGLTIEAARKTNLVSKVRLRDATRLDDENHYLNPQVAGGQRAFKAFEARLYRKGIIPAGYYTVPAAGATIDSYGNMSRGQITQILSYFEAFGDAGFRSDMTDANRARLARGTRSRYGIEYFAIQPSATGSLKPGIYMRILSNFGAAIKPVLLYVRATSYQKRLDIERIANETYNRDFDRLFTQNLIDAVNTALPE